MSFEDDKDPIKKIGIKQVSTKKSIFDGAPKKPSKIDFEKEVDQYEQKASAHQNNVHTLLIDFMKAIKDPTLAKNKNILQQEMEKDIVAKMIKLGEDLNSDDSLKEGTGSLSWIMLLLKTSLIQRDRINELEYIISDFQNHLDAKIKRMISDELKK